MALACAFGSVIAPAEYTVVGSRSRRTFSGQGRSFLTQTTVSRWSAMLLASMQISDGWFHISLEDCFIVMLVLLSLIRGAPSFRPVFVAGEAETEFVLLRWRML